MHQDSRLSCSALYRAEPKTCELEKLQIQKQLRAGVTEPTTSEWAIPVLSVLKKGGSLQFWIDYRRLNETTIKDTYPLPRTEECIDSLGTVRFLSTRVANSGYWQILIEKKNSRQNSVCTPRRTIASYANAVWTNQRSQQHWDEHWTSFHPNSNGKHAGYVLMAYLSLKFGGRISSSRGRNFAHSWRCPCVVKDIKMLVFPHHGDIPGARC